MIDLIRLGGKMSPYNYPFMRPIKEHDQTTSIRILSSKIFHV